MSIYQLPKAHAAGGFPWRSLAIALLMITASSWLATQYAAAELGYQRALGPNLARVGEVAVYQPFAWTVWSAKVMLRADTPRDVRHVLLAAHAIALGGVLVAILMFAATSHSRRRSRPSDAKDLHGSARWANSRDVKAAGLMGNRLPAIYVGAWSEGNRMQWLKHHGQDHVLAFAPTRSGKGVGLVLPTLLGSWFDSVIVYDIKGENWAKTSGFRSTLGPVFKFAPTEDLSSRFNPLAEIRIGTDLEVKDTHNLVQMLIHDGVNAHDPYWHQAAEALLIGLVLHVCYVAHNDGKVACLADVRDILTSPAFNFTTTLETLKTFPHRPDGTPHPTIVRKAQEALEKAEKNFDGVVSQARTALNLYEDPLVARNTSDSDFAITDLIDHEQPVSLYLVVPASDQKRLRPLTRLIFTMIVNRLTERMDFDGATQRQNRCKLLFLIDEFPSLRRMDVFASALSYMAGYGLRAFLITQDIRQIEETYGNKESIVSNCQVRVAFAPNNYETAQLISNMLGRQTVLHTSYSFSGKRTSVMPGNVNASLNHFERSLLTPDEVMRLEQPRKTTTPEGREIIVTPGQSLIFVTGHRPILGWQILYFFEIQMQKRSAMQTPTKMVTITEDGEVIEQRPLNRSANVISRVEHPPKEATEIVQRATVEAEAALATDTSWPV